MIDADKLATELIRDEDERLFPYRCSAGKLTLGVGHNIEDRGISRAASRFILAEDIAEVLQDLEKLRFWKDLDPVRQRVLANMRFNLGATKFAEFKVTLRRVEAGQYLEAAQAMLRSRWASQVGERALRLAAMMRDGRPE